MMTIKKIVSTALLFFTFSAFAQFAEKEYNLYTPVAPTTLESLIINNPNGITVYDSEAGFPNQVDKINTAFAYVSLYIDNDLPPFEWYEVNVQLILTPLNPNGSLGTSLAPKDFKVTYNPFSNSNSFSDLNYIKLNNAYGVKVQVVQGSLTVKKAGVITNSIRPTNVIVKTGFKVQRYYEVSEQLINITHTPTSKNSLLLSWANFPGAIEYELEWTWVDGYKKDNLTGIRPETEILFSERDFELNNSRILTSNTNYEIPLIYSKGYLIYRLRPVGRDKANSDLITYGSWSSGTNQKTNLTTWPNKFVINFDHENGKNWQFQASYAENGKKKEVVSYFDGSLRNRQTVTKVNTDNNAIVGEVIYDAQGRAAIEILPTPTKENAIKFYNNFNLNNSNNSNSSYSFKDFDISNSDLCLPVVNGMSDFSGSSKYYSSNSDFKGVLNNDYIPDAKLYPFSQIEYTPDNTGRIARKGGVGFEHQLGTGHEMKYFYSTPTDKELNRLFGYSVGKVEHYKKNTVVDPNGQVSVSYIDPQGRTIATALSGSKPEGSALDGLQDENSNATVNAGTSQNPNNIPIHQMMKVDLYKDYNLFKSTGSFYGFKDQSITAKQIGVNGQSVSHKFTYEKNANASNFSLSDCPKNYPIVYNLKLSLNDQCGTNIINVNQQIGNESLTGATSTASFQSTTYSHTLNTGSYSLTKDLTVDKDVLNSYADDYISRLKTPDSGCYIDPKTFEPTPEIDYCNLTCSTCFERIGSTIENYVSLELKKYYNLTDSVTFTVTVSPINAAVSVTPPVIIGVVFDPVEINALKDRFVQEWKILVEQCDALCKKPTYNNNCNAQRSVMLTDVSPQGQYGETDSGETDSDIAENFKLSVFNYEPDLTKPSGALFRYNKSSDLAIVRDNDWKHPIPEYTNSTGGIYVDVVKHDVEGSESTYSPEIDNGAPTISYNPIRRDVNGDVIVQVKPNQLKNVSDFIASWDDNWANSLIKYHPEFPYLEYFDEVCKKTNTFNVPHARLTEPNFNVDLTSDGYDDLLMKTPTAAQAKSITRDAISIFDISSDEGIKEIFKNDPYFQQLSFGFDTKNIDRVGIMSAAINPATAEANYVKIDAVYLSMFQMAVKTVVGNPLTSGSTTYSLPQIKGLSDTVKDQIWNTYKSLYVSFKGKIKHVFSNIYAMENGAYNGCIGGDVSTSVTNVLTDNFAQKASLYNYINGISKNSLCKSTSGVLYKNKEKRFIPIDASYDSASNPSDVINDMYASNAYQYYTKTGSCPLLFDLDMLLDGFFRHTEYHVDNDPLNLTNKAFTGQYLSKSFLSSLLKYSQGTSLDGTNFPLNSVNITTSRLSNSNELKIDFSGNLGGTASTAFSTKKNNTLNSLKINVPTGYSWSNYNNLSSGWKITEVKQLYYDATASTPAQGVFKFKGIATIQNTSTNTLEDVVFTGETFAKIGVCSIANNGVGDVLDPGAGNNEANPGGCDKKFRFNSALTKLLNELRKMNKLNSTTAVDLNTIDAYKNSYLPEFFNDLGLTKTLKWIKEGDVYKFVKPNNLPVAMFEVKTTSFNGVEPTATAIKDFVYNAGSATKMNFEGASISTLNNTSDLFKWTFTESESVPNAYPNGKLLEIVGKINGVYIQTRLDFSCCTGITSSPCLEGDKDCDGFLDLVDNCPEKYNPNQLPTECVTSGGETILTCESIINVVNGGAGIYRIRLDLGENSTGTVGLRFNASTNPDRFQIFFDNDNNGVEENVADSYYRGSLTQNMAGTYNLPINIYSSSGNSSSGNWIGNGAQDIVTIPNPTYPTKTGVGEITFFKQNSSKRYITIVITAPRSGTVWYITSFICPGDLDLTIPTDIPFLTQRTESPTDDSSDLNIYRIADNNNYNLESPSCTSCTPKQVEPVGCNQATKVDYIDFLDLVQDTIHYENDNNPDTSDSYTFYKSGLINGYTVEQSEIDDFCKNNYQYLLASYKHYIDTLEVENSNDIRFRTIAQFGDTFLKIGYSFIDDVINGYKEYYEGEILAGSQDILNWNNWVNNVYVYDKPDDEEHCLPAPLQDVYSQDNPSSNGDTPCTTLIQSLKGVNGAENYANFLQEKRKAFIKSYLEEAMKATEKLDMEFADKEYQYTLYYYDQAGNLTQTVPPEGVKRFNPTEMELKNKQINDFRNGVNGASSLNTTNDNSTLTLLQPSHTFKTQYKYNSLNQLVWQNTPDGGETRFAYDKLGRIIASQNAKQIIANKYSYTYYDELGRITEAGETIYNNYSINDLGRLIDPGMVDPLDAVGATLPKTEVTRTIYDTNPQLDNTTYASTLFTTYTLASVEEQLLNNRNRVSGVFYYEQYLTAFPLAFENAILYNYDIHGNVKELVTYYPDLKNSNCNSTIIGQNQLGNDIINDCQSYLKKIVYDYDLISGNVNKVTFQPNKLDQYIHKYAYDADNRIVNVQTSKDGELWETDARYFYYPHGPLSRVEIGDKKVQGVDYAYTLHGWLKAVNGENLTSPANDLGKDGSLTSTTKTADAFGYSLNYYKDDYKAISEVGITDSFKPLMYSRNVNNASPLNLYNGNIKQMTTAIRKGNNELLDVQKNNYSYDQLNRITRMNSVAINPTTSFSKASISSSYSYDRNGNLQNLMRSAFTTTGSLSTMDNLRYDYSTNNQLALVEDNAGNTANFDNDLESQVAQLAGIGIIYNKSNKATHNYIYDEIGQLIEDRSEKIKIDWRVDGKVKQVTNNKNGNIITFEYDGLGNRIGKRVEKLNDIQRTHYSRDAQGNVMAVYDEKYQAQESLQISSVLNSFNVTDIQIKRAISEIVVSQDGAPSVFSSSANVTLNAGNSISFRPGFWVRAGAILTAKITTVNTTSRDSWYVLKEHHIYGSSRLGIEENSTPVYAYSNNSTTYKIDPNSKKRPPILPISGSFIDKNFALKISPFDHTKWTTALIDQETIANPVLDNFNINTKFKLTSTLVNGEYSVGQLLYNGTTSLNREYNIKVYDQTIGTSLISFGDDEIQCVLQSSDGVDGVKISSGILVDAPLNSSCPSVYNGIKQNIINANEDGYVEFTHSRLNSGSYVALNINGLNYGFRNILIGSTTLRSQYLIGNQVAIFAGTNIGIGEVCRIVRKGNTIDLLRNGTSVLSNPLVIDNLKSYPIHLNIHFEVTKNNINNLRAAKLESGIKNINNTLQLSLIKDIIGYKPKFTLTQFETNQSNVTTVKKASILSANSISETDIIKNGLEFITNLTINNNQLSGTIVFNGTQNNLASATLNPSTDTLPTIYTNQLGGTINGIVAAPYDMCYFNYSMGSNGQQISRNFSFDDDHNSNLSVSNNGVDMQQFNTENVGIPFVRNLGSCLRDTDLDGIFDIYEAKDITSLQFIDTDGDGLANHNDPDDDGDGIFSKFEGNDGNSIDGKPDDALNTDSSDTPNYLDLDDDNDGYATWETYEGGPGTVNAATTGNTYTNDDDSDNIKNYLDSKNGNFPTAQEIQSKYFVSLTGDKRFELSNHLGNVLSVISDKKIPFLVSGILNKFNPDVISYSDYYPFGMLVPNRHGSSDSYRYGFNTQEKVDEISGDGNHFTAPYWEYDPRIGRRWNLDPVPQVSISDYATNYNNPIYYNDPDGDCPNCATAAAGAVIGGLIGGLVEAGTQYYKHGEIRDWKAVGGATAQGAITGAAAGFTGGASLLTTAAVSGAANAAGGVASNKIQGKEISIQSVAADFITGAAFGAVFKKLSTTLQSTLKSAEGSIWKIAAVGPNNRGFVYEQLLAAKGAVKGVFKTDNFPAIDAFYKGVATSIKTIDLKAKTYLNGNTVFNKLKGYVDDLDNFDGAFRKNADELGNDVNIISTDIKKRVLDIGIPKGATKAQLKQIEKVKTYAKSKNINVNVRTVE